MSFTNQLGTINSQPGAIQPASVPVDNAWERWTNGTSATTLNGTITNSQTIISVSNGAVFPSLSKFRIRIDDELMIVTIIAGNELVVTRGAEGTTAAIHVNGTVVDFEITAGSLDGFRSQSRQYGHDANLPNPADCKEGMIYITDDSLLIYRHNGSDWDVFGPNYRMKPPKLSDFTWDNQGTALVSGTYGVVTFNFSSPSATFQAHVLKKAAPATPYRAAIMPCNFDVFSQYWGYGICVRNSSSGKLVTYGPLYRDTGGLKLDIIKWNNSTSMNASYYTLLSQLNFLTEFPLTQMWLGIYHDGTNRHYQYSNDGINWLDYNSISATDFTTNDEIGFYVVRGHATLSPTVQFPHWEP